MNSLTVVLSLPPKELSPNGRHHWRAKSPKVRQYRHDAGIAALFALDGRDAPQWKHVRVEPVFYLPDKRGLSADADNRIASLKSACDGLQDAGIVANDRGIMWGDVRHVVNPETPRVQLHITPVTVTTGATT